METKRFDGIVPPKEWLLGINEPLIIAGPCSAETEEQVMATATQLKVDGRVHVFRAGIWKPRTQPNSFEGVGSIGLEWLRRVKRETGLAVATEIGSAKHAFEAIKYGVDLLWIGARTTSNPFAMQEIAESLRGVDIPVLVKNPLSPDLDLWLGAIERLHAVGIRKLGAIHRGFFTWEKTELRNQPSWHIPLEMMRKFPELPVLCDPSHISGKRELVPSIAQRAFDIRMHGLMVETHITPETAWSDARQQLTPESLGIMLSNLIPSTETEPNNLHLNNLRAEIDEIDDQLISIIARRMQTVEKIAALKSEENLNVIQPKRWKDVMIKVKTTAQNRGLRPTFAEGLFNAIHAESVLLQADILREK
ncbi:MAG TPA: chorismate mutase [Williamwhitmania sp.]|nr:chorismate mutase [Williamwhitmania sp.]